MRRNPVKNLCKWRVQRDDNWEEDRIGVRGAGGFHDRNWSRALINISLMESRLEALATDSLPGLYSIDRAESAAKNLRPDVLRHIASDSQREMDEMETFLAKDEAALAAELKSHQGTIHEARDRELFSKIQPALDRFMACWPKIRPLSRATKTAEAMKIYDSEMLPASNDLLRAFADEVAFNKDSGESNSRRALGTGARARFMTWGFLLFQSSPVCCSHTLSCAASARS